ncbi:Myc-type, basic helix-loop-helix (bHLH) domain-containing protein [Cynara cardunculus var. scolymus]|uniref:Myc-type, basic helix-loop-helix (BHLH) domain-containing protein n=1 Tax=Cynara cardunculus var. scolymus TaxID=59895 RepID=A0A124SDH1_CYNCS|nr:Myc-type, basic helix-loop-helix (bHLH) domain-containing protein [Cynara cardunculus var. scolymus]
MMVAPDEDDNSNCFFDFSLIEQIPVPGGELPSLESDFHWSSNPFHGPSNLSSAGFLDSAGTPDCSKELGSRKRFQELNEILDPGRPPKTDKMVILGDAIRRVTQLRDEAAEKNELRDEKQKLKAEKERLEQQVKAFSRPPATAAFYPPPPHSAMPIPFPPRPIVDSKFLPVMGYHGVPMWPFASATAVDTSEDHVLRSPLA